MERKNTKEEFYLMIFLFSPLNLFSHPSLSNYRFVPGWFLVSLSANL